MKKSDLIAKRVAALEAANAINTKVKSENRDFTAEEETSFNTQLDSAKELKTQIEKLDARETRVTEMNNEIKILDIPTGRRTGPNRESALTSDMRDPRLEDPSKGFKHPRDYMLAVMQSHQAHKITDERLRPLASLEKRLAFFDRKQNGELVATAGGDEQAVFTDPYGGFLVPEAFTPTLLRVEPEEDPMGGQTMRIPMQSPTVKIPARVDKDHTSSVSGGLTVSRRPESVAGSTSQMKFHQVILEASSLFGGAYVTEELLTDSPMSFAAIVAAGFEDQFTYQLVNERLTGTGTGEYQGILNCPSLISVAKEAGQAAKTINYQNVLKMTARCWRFSRAFWLANHNCKPQLAQMSLAVGTGGTAVYMPSAREDFPDLLMGRPIKYNEYCKTVGTQGDLILGMWGEYLEGVYQPMQSAESIHVRFLNNERTFKFWTRNAGAPWWLTALTPKNGDTLSPFVVLDARA